MSDRFLFLPPASTRTAEWAERIRVALPEIDVVVSASREEALDALPQARGAFGTLDPELLAAAAQLRPYRAGAKFGTADSACT